MKRPRIKIGGDLAFWVKVLGAFLVVGVLLYGWSKITAIFTGISKWWGVAKATPTATYVGQGQVATPAQEASGLPIYATPDPGLSQAFGGSIAPPTSAALQDDLGLTGNID